MADPATITLIARAAIAATTDKRTWKIIGVVITTLLTPFILMIVVIICLLSGTSNHNNASIDLAFHGGAISSQMPADYADHIRDMRDSFSKLDTTIGEISREIENGSFDETRVKAVFYSLFFGADSLQMDGSFYRTFADCFVRYETWYDEKARTSSTVAIPLTSLPEIYAKLESSLSRIITNEYKANASEIYNRILYGDIPTEGDGLQHWINNITSGSTDIHAVNGGTVLFVRYKTTGYGYHLAIDHGGGKVTLYGHCSKILVTEGQTISQGEVIARVGSTGKSTGSHLHFEVIVDGVPQNPRSYLP